MISIQQIAKKINISRNTVSKVLNNKEGVSPSLRNKVLQTAAEMGYTKLPVNRSGLPATQGRENDISVVVTNPGFSNYWIELINSIAGELHGTGRNLIYNYVYYDHESATQVPQAIPAKGVAGMIVINVYDADTISSIAKTGLPIVYSDISVNTTCEEGRGDVVLYEGQDSVYKITRHILNQGAKRLGFIGDTTYCRTIYERWQGFQMALQDSGITLDPAFCLTKGLSNHFYDAEEVGNALSTLESFPDAFVCANDIIAYRAIQYFSEKNIKVPEDILISGFDNIQEILPNYPELTTVDAGVKALGKRLVRQLLDRIGEPEMPYETVRIATTPIFKSSTEK